MGLFSHVRGKLVRGLALVLPLLITVWLLRLLFDVIHENVTPWVKGVLEWAEIPGLENLMARLGIPLIAS